MDNLNPFLSDINNSYQIERKLFPLKINNSNIPCFIVPIRPEFAMHLFQANISETDLFGGDTNLLFNKENVYYRSAKQKILESNSRILWYISKGSNKYSDTMTITTSSYLSEYEISTPKALYNKNKRLGVFQWKDVLNTANRDLDNEIMAFNFELNENFKHPITRGELNPIYQKYRKKDFFASPTCLRITEDMYFEIYSIGNRIKYE